MHTTEGEGKVAQGREREKVTSGSHRGCTEGVGLG